MRDGHSVQGSNSEVTAQHHQDLAFESPTQVFVSMELPQKGPSVTTGSPVGSALSRDFDIGKKIFFCNLRM